MIRERMALRQLSAAALVTSLLVLTSTSGAKEVAETDINPFLREYTITIDPTGIEPPRRWHVPGQTPLIWSLDPDTTDAFSSTQTHELKLKPGLYHFGTFTFDFPFRVTLEGVLDYSESLDQCVRGRGTQQLKIQCGRTQPYSGRPDY